MSGPTTILVLFDADQRLVTASAGLLPDPFTPGQSLESARAVLETLKPAQAVQTIRLGNGASCLAVTPTDGDGHDAKRHFLATMTHELRTPLNVVIGFADALARETDIAAERVTEFATAIHTAGQELLGVINTMIDVARIEQGRFELHADTIDIAHMINTCVTAAQEQARRAGVTLRGVAETAPFLLRGDERRLRQVLGQLLANALTFTEAGGKVTLTASVTQDGALDLHVDDTGIGMPPEQIARAFEPFSQGDVSLSRRTPGVGLGLYVARVLIQAHGGTLTLHSTPGVGTSARITLPRTRLIHPSASATLSQEMP